MSEMWELGQHPYQAEVDEARPCGCPLEYHLADCDGSRAMTKDDYLTLHADLYPDDWPEEE